jgi:hypothetical protein
LTLKGRDRRARLPPQEIVHRSRGGFHGIKCIRRSLPDAKLVKMAPGFQSVNTLTSEKLTDMGNSAAFYSVLVEVGRVSGQ